MKSLFKKLILDDSHTKYDKLGNYCDVQKGLSYKGEGLSDVGIPLINLGNVRPGGGYRFDKNKAYIGEYKEKNTVKPGDIIIANTDMTYDRVILGSPIIVPDYDGDILFSHHLFAFRNVKVPRSFLYYYLRTEEFHGICESSANGTTVLSISKEDVLDAPMPVPDVKHMDMFTSVADPILDFSEKITDQSNSLVEMRNNLLPRLMSGEVDLSNIQLLN